MKQRRERAMGDPEIQGILTDPVMTQVLPCPCCACQCSWMEPAVDVQCISTRCSLPGRSAEAPKGASGSYLASDGCAGAFGRI